MSRAERRRQEKVNNQKPVYYQYTLQQIEEIKRKAVKDCQERIQQEIKKEIEEEFKRRSEALGGDNEDNRLKSVLCLLLAVPASVLCEEFGWKPIIKGRKTRLEHFSECVVKEVNRICDDETVDIREYGEAVLEKYGVKYELSD